MIHFDSWFGSASDTGCNRGQWRINSSKFILPATKKVPKMQFLLGIVSRCCFFKLFFKMATHYWVLIWGICLYCFAGILRISKIGFIVFVHCFNRHFCLSLGLWHPNKTTRYPCRLCCAKTKNQMRSAEDATGGMTGNAVWRSMDQKQGTTTRWGPDYSKQNGGALPFQWPKMNSLIAGGLNP